MSNTKQVQVSFPIFGMLGLLFIGLKLTGHIAWSWIWVLAPFWIPFTLVLTIVFFVLLIGILASVLK